MFLVADDYSLKLWTDGKILRNVTNWFLGRTHQS